MDRKIEPTKVRYTYEENGDKISYVIEEHQITSQKNDGPEETFYWHPTTAHLWDWFRKILPDKPGVVIEKLI